ncbi:MAG: hypothetical protein JXR83_00705 [Deltaproteobacteria bacterium]|nr:hypothetical protein [Deltaproteobacteria bacterium]
MKTRAMLVAAAVASLVGSSACTPARDGDVIARLTVSNSGALVTAKGRVLRTRENARLAGYQVVLARTSDSGRVEWLLNASGEVERERSGESQDANAQSSEQADGDNCTIFTDSAGNQVANGCAIPEPGQGDVRCERLDIFDASGEPLICSVCYDASGQVVTRECHGEVPGCDPNDSATGCAEQPICDSTNDPDCLPPPVEECRLVHEGDRTCRVCSTPDGQTYTECYRDPDPIRCEIVEMSDGLICTYCFDESGELVERNCVAAPCDPTLPGGDDGCLPPPPIRCEEFAAQDGTYCRICYDELGNAIERQCEPQPPPATTCREYTEADGRVCRICYGENGEIVSRECTEPTCLLDQTGSNLPAIACQDDAGCPPGALCQDGVCACASVPPPECRLVQTQNGYYCEICGDANGDGVADLSDARCYPEPVDPIACTEVQSSDGQICVVCYDPAGNVVQDGCRSEPPRCVVQEGADSTGSNGQACEICYDEIGNVVYNSCDQVVCSSERIEENGRIFECEVCQTASGEISRTCRELVCDPDSSGTDCQPPPACEPGSGSTDPSTGLPCVERWTLWFDAIQCGGNPWERETAGSNDAALDQTALVSAWLESLGVVAFSIRFEQVYQNTCDACQCPRGDRLVVETDAAGAQILMQFGFQVR